MPIVLRRSYEDQARTLWEYEQWRCVWRLATSAIAFVLAPVVFVALTVLAAYIAGDDFVLRAALLAAVVAGGCAWFVPRLAGRRFHRQIIEKRLRLYQTPNPPTETPVLVHSSDAESARSALRRARFNPWSGLDVPMPPPDAPHLNYKINAHEPEAFPQSSSDEDRVQRIVRALTAATIDARVAGIDTPTRAAI